VIISPLKAFRDIAKNPDFKGLIIVVGLLLLATTGLYSSYSSKVFFFVDNTETSLLTSNIFSNYILIVLFQTAFLFFLNWLIYAVILLFFMRMFGERSGSWRSFFILVGYAFSVLIVQSAVGALLMASLPEVHLQITSWPPSDQDAESVNSSFNELWGPTIAFKALRFLTYPLINIIDIWLVLLSVIAVRVFSELSWGKASKIVGTAFLIRFFLRYLFGL